MRLSSGEILMILMIALLVFGASRLPDLGKGLGQGMRSFRDALKGLDEAADPPEVASADKKKATEADRKSS